MPRDLFLHTCFEHGNNGVWASTSVSEGEPFGEIGTVGACGHQFAFQRHRSRREQASMIGVFFSPHRDGNFTTLRQQQGAVAAVKGPMPLSTHSQRRTQTVGTHPCKHLVKFARKGFLCTQTWEVACMVDDHSSVNRQRSSNGGVGRQFSYDGGQVSRQQTFNHVP